jgi:alkanesulfonate monooxygenase SsuD/methylene tetrahydromethanopterin reductase-like flavin-dependent oxidoreductase (luciferase family)
VAEAPGLILGGHADASYARAARFADGWIASGSGVEQYAAGAAQAKAAWSAAGRQGEPRTTALAYFSLGDRAAEEAHACLTDYYAWLGKEIAEMIVASAAKDPAVVKEYVSAYESAGCEELILFPSSADPAQVDLLADAAGL